MKTGVTASLFAHTLLLSWGLLAYTGPKPYSVADIEALPIDIVPIEELTKTVQGDKKAPLARTPAVKPTSKPVVDKKAVNAGNTKRDSKSSDETKQAKVPVEAAAPARSQAKPKTPARAEATPKDAREAVPVPATDLAAKPEPKVKIAAIAPDQQASVASIAEPVPQEEALKLPDVVPTPRARPSTAKAKTAKTNQRKDTDKIAAKIAAAAPASKSKKEADKFSALLNRQKPTASGARRSTRQAALGARKSNGATKLSQSEMDALRGKIQSCFNLTAGMADAEELRATVKVRLNRAGELEGRPRVTASGGSAAVRRAFKGAAQRAVQRCAPYDSLPQDKYETWADLIVNFDVSDML